jgi:hypothetical protein
MLSSDHSCHCSHGQALIDSARLEQAVGEPRRRLKAEGNPFRQGVCLLGVVGQGARTATRLIARRVSSATVGGSMILIMAFAIYVIVKKRAPITKTLMLTGQQARNFGICLLVAAIPLSVLISKIVGVLPPQIAGNAILVNIIAFVVLCTATVSMALLFRRSLA